MARIMNEWEVQKVSNNLSRVDSYRQDNRNNVYMNPESMTDVMSEWEVQKIASNLDRIDMYRNNNNSSSDGNDSPISILIVLYGIIVFAMMFLCADCPDVFYTFLASSFLGAVIYSVCRIYKHFN